MQRKKVPPAVKAYRPADECTPGWASDLHMHSDCGHATGDELLHRLSEGPWALSSPAYRVCNMSTCMGACLFTCSPWPGQKTSHAVIAWSVQRAQGDSRNLEDRAGLDHREQQAQSQKGVAEVNDANTRGSQAAGCLTQDGWRLPPGTPTACKCWSLLRLAPQQLPGQFSCITAARRRQVVSISVFAPVRPSRSL